VVPDPAEHRQELPGNLWRRWERGEFESRAEFWRYLERLGLDVDRLLAREGERCAA